SASFPGRHGVPAAARGPLHPWAGQGRFPPAVPTLPGPAVPPGTGQRYEPRRTVAPGPPPAAKVLPSYTPASSRTLTCETWIFRPGTGRLCCIIIVPQTDGFFLYFGCTKNPGPQSGILGDVYKVCFFCRFRAGSVRK